MTPRKKSFDDDSDWGMPNDSFDNSTVPDPFADFGYGQTPPPPRRLPWGWIAGSAAAVLLLVGLVVGGIWLFRSLAHRPTQTAANATQPGETQPAATTLPVLPTETQPAAPDLMATPNGGLAYSVYSANGQFVAAYDAQGQKLAAPLAGMPAALPSGGTVDLSQLDQIAQPTGAIFDPQTGQLIVVGKPASTPGSGSSDFLVALHGVYTGNEPGVSIDPGPSQTIQGVRYIGPTRGTHAGWVMFEADRLMKNLSLGQDNITNQPVTSAVPGHGTMFDFSQAADIQSEQEVRRRFWFVVKEARLARSADGLAVVIQSVTLEVQTEYLDENWQTLPNQPPDPAGQAFAAQLSTHYAEYAAEFPVLAELEALARWSALAHWFKDAQISAANSALLAAPIQPYETPDQTPAITVTRNYTSTTGDTTWIQTLLLWGGVDLSLQNIYVQAAPAELGLVEQPAQAWQQSAGRTAHSTTNGIEQQVSGAALAPAARNFTYTPPLPFETTLGSPEPVFELRYQSGAQPTPGLFAGWQLRRRRLTFSDLRQAIPNSTETIPTSVVMEAPGGQAVELLFDSYFTQANEPIYENRAAGWLGIRQADGYLVQQVTFHGDGQYSYDHDLWMKFALDGQISEWAYAAGQKLTYTYADGRLLEAAGPGGKLVFQYNPATQQLSDMLLFGTDQGVRLVYNAQGQLIAIESRAGQQLGEFGYDGSQFISSVAGFNEPAPLLIALDDQGHVSALTRGDTIDIYAQAGDFSQQIYRMDAKAQVLLKAAGADAPAELGRLATVVRLSQMRQGVDHVAYLRKLAGQVMLIWDGLVFSLQVDALKNAEQLKEALKALPLNLQENEHVLVADGDAQMTLFWEGLPEYGWLSSEALDEMQLAGNLTSLAEATVLTPQNTRIILAVPSGADELRQAQLDPAEAGRWQGQAEAYKQIAGQGGFDYAATGGNTGLTLAQQIELALANTANVLIVVGHSDGQRIYLPDGASFSPADVSPEVAAAIEKNRPAVILFSCQTSKITNAPSLAKKLLDLGARLVIAPEKNIPVTLTRDVLSTLFKYSAQGANIVDAMIQTLRQFELELPKYKYIIGQPAEARRRE